MPKIYALIFVSVRSQVVFVSEVVPQLSELIEDIETKLIFSDEYIFVAKYLDNRGFRACTIYHVGDTPRHLVGGYPLVGNFDSKASLEAALRSDANVILEF